MPDVTTNTTCDTSHELDRLIGYLMYRFKDDIDEFETYKLVSGTDSENSYNYEISNISIDLMNIGTTLKSVVHNIHHLNSDKVGFNDISYNPEIQDIRSRVSDMEYRISQIERKLASLTESEKSEFDENDDK